MKRGVAITRPPLLWAQTSLREKKEERRGRSKTESPHSNQGKQAVRFPFYRWENRLRKVRSLAQGHSAGKRHCGDSNTSMAGSSPQALSGEMEQGLLAPSSLGREQQRPFQVKGCSC